MSEKSKGQAERCLLKSGSLAGQYQEPFCSGNSLGYSYFCTKILDFACTSEWSGLPRLPRIAPYALAMSRFMTNQEGDRPISDSLEIKSETWSTYVGQPYLSHQTLEHTDIIKSVDCVIERNRTRRKSDNSAARGCVGGNIRRERNVKRACVVK